MVQSGLPPGRRGTLAPGLTQRLREDVLRGPIWRDRTARTLVVASVLAILALIGYVALWLPALPPFLPLHYNSVGSVDLLGPRGDLYKMPAIGVAVLFADLTLAALIYRRERWASLTLAGASVLVQLILIVATINIIRLAFGD